MGCQVGGHRTLPNEIAVLVIAEIWILHDTNNKDSRKEDISELKRLIGLNRRRDEGTVSKLSR